ncbi:MULTISPECIES: pseudaminic acid synthase [Thalassotalea]|uniref:Pseudaminic acid synthase n=1 Tax=Thalassotalea castellviae TaxID=3075612 RepID=A0ABU2ZY65_9GAMM|nr:pseudaminic acid synthase [Thalassotalea sp. W431]MDT0602860.1 pseudaminic acid synthase [Thalassotalea sp. W431]
MLNHEISINGRKIGKNHPPYIIAEVSANHNGSIEKALQTISMAKNMGADAVKIQTYTADTMTIDSELDDFKIKGGLWDGHNLYQLYQQAHTPYEWHQELFEHAKKIGITLFSTPFDDSAVDLLEQLNTPAYKIASFELTDIPLITRVAKTGKPMIMSTGMANEQEITEAVTAATQAGCQQLVLLHCISAYPAPIAQCNLATLVDIEQRFNTLSGLSDHTLSTTVAITAVALGACVIEKHVTLSREDKGPDSEFSIEPAELKNLCQESRIAWQAIGSAGYEQKQAERDNVKFRRSIYFVEDIAKGTTITAKHIRRIRPGFGLAPKYFQEIIGKVTTEDIKKGTPTEWRLFN